MKSIIEQFDVAVGRQLWSNAEALLISYFRTEVAKDAKKLVEFFEMRKRVKSKKHRPVVSELFANSTKVAEKVFAQVGNDIEAILPESRVVKPKALDSFVIDPENKDFIKVVAPFVGNDFLRLKLFGVTFDEEFVSATDAYTMLYFPENPTNKQGIYCVTKKCFEYNEKGTLDISPYQMRSAIPMWEKGGKGYSISTWRYYRLIHLLEQNGFDGIYGHPMGVFYFDGVKVGVNLSFFKKHLNAFFLLGYERVSIHFTGQESAICIVPEGTSHKAYNNYESLLGLLMPIRLDQETKVPYRVIIDLEESNYRLAISKKRTAKKALNKDTKTIDEAIVALTAAEEFAGRSEKTKLSSAIEALRTALEFA